MKPTGENCKSQGNSHSKNWRPHHNKRIEQKVAINECYLKRDLKNCSEPQCLISIKTNGWNMQNIFLYEKGLSVTEVSMLLGYSSISHFSTAFKKHTGLKPCELLLR